MSRVSSEGNSVMIDLFLFLLLPHAAAAFVLKCEILFGFFPRKILKLRFVQYSKAIFLNFYEHVKQLYFCFDGLRCDCHEYGMLLHEYHYVYLEKCFNILYVFYRRVSDKICSQMIFHYCIGSGKDNLKLNPNLVNPDTTKDFLSKTFVTKFQQCVAIDINMYIIWTQANICSTIINAGPIFVQP